MGKFIVYAMRGWYVYARSVGRWALGTAVMLSPLRFSKWLPLKPQGLYLNAEEGEHTYEEYIKSAFSIKAH